MGTTNLRQFSDDDLMKIIESGSVPTPTPESKNPMDLSNYSTEDLMKIAEGPKPPKDDGFVPQQYRGMVKGALNTLPTAGMIGGGIAGAGLTGAATLGMGAPGGALVGAGLGGGLGESIKQLGERYLLGEQKDAGQVAKSVGLAIPEGAAAEMGGQIIGKGVKMAAATPIGQKVTGAISRGMSKVGEALTGISQKEIQTFAKNADEIEAMARNSDNSTAEAADQIRQKFQEQIQGTRKGLNAQISKALEVHQGQVPVDPILKRLVDSKATINPKLYPEQIKEIDGLITKISSVSGDAGSLSAAQANEVKSFLQDYASSTYRNPGIFALGDQSAKAAKAAAAEARLLVNKAAPQVASANNSLANLHRIEDKLNANLIVPGKPESALMAVGSGGNPRNLKSLQELGQATGFNMVGEAEKLAAMRSFGDPKLLPTDFTGKSAARIGTAVGLGSVAGGIPGGLIAGALTSPATIKQAIKAGILTKEILANPSVQQQMSRPMLDYAGELLNEQAGPMNRRMQQLKQGK